MSQLETTTYEKNMPDCDGLQDLIMLLLMYFDTTFIKGTYVVQYIIMATQHSQGSSHFMYTAFSLKFH